jgi:hypothetical protein
VVRLVALVILYLHTLKQHILSSRQDSPVQHGFPAPVTPYISYSIPTNNFGPHASYSSLPSHSLPLPNLLSVPRQSRAGRRRREQGTRWSSRAGRRRWRRTRRGAGSPTSLCLPVLQRGRTPPPATPVEATTSSPAPLPSHGAPSLRRRGARMRRPPLLPPHARREDAAAPPHTGRQEDTTTLSSPTCRRLPRVRQE